MTLTQALIERAHFAALCVAATWYQPEPMTKEDRRNQAEYKARAIVAYDRAYDVAIGKDKK